MYATCHNMAAAAALLHMGNCHESSSELIRCIDHTSFEGEERKKDGGWKGRKERRSPRDYFM